VDRDRVWEFMERFVEMAAGAATLTTLAVADRSGLLAALAGAGPATIPAIAHSAGLDERYTEEMLAQLTAAGVLDHDPSAGTFHLPDERAAVIADDTSPYAMAGWLDMLPETATFIDDVVAAARTGGGVPADRFPDRVVRGVARANAPSMRILLTRRWLPAMPDVTTKLEQGIRVADVGCGSGAAVITMARAYPNSEFFGYDIDPRAVSAAIEESANLSNVRFEVRSADEIPTEPSFELVTAFDVIHDLADPKGVLSRIHDALADDGTLLMMEPAVSARLEENIAPRAAMLYGVSLMFCMTQSLAAGGPGLGTAWGPEKAERLCRDAGFSRFRRLPIENPFSAFFEVRI
jgi:SAM-dependent methyltransferase